MPNETLSPEIIPASTIEALVRAEVDVQIATAQKFPRQIERSLSRAEELVKSSTEVAEECIYTLPRDGKEIRGGSIRLAEIIASTWGNIRAGARVVAVEDRVVVCQGFCHDLESNAAVQTEARRKIITKDGRRYSEDMIAQTANAGCSIAYRNAVFKAIPKAIWGRVYDACESGAKGNDKVLPERRKKCIAKFKEKGVSQDEILKRVKRSKLSEITGDDLVTLLGLYNAIDEGSLSVAEAFGRQRQQEEVPLGEEAEEEKGFFS